MAQSSGRDEWMHREKLLTLLFLFIDSMWWNCEETECGRTLIAAVFEDGLY